MNCDELFVELGRMVHQRDQARALADQVATALREARYRLRLIGLDLDDDGIAAQVVYEQARKFWPGDPSASPVRPGDS